MLLFICRRARTAPGLALVWTSLRHHRLTASSPAMLGGQDFSLSSSHPRVPIRAASRWNSSSHLSGVPPGVVLSPDVGGARSVEGGRRRSLWVGRREEEGHRPPLGEA